MENHTLTKAGTGARQRRLPRSVRVGQISAPLLIEVQMVEVLLIRRLIGDLSEKVPM